MAQQLIDELNEGLPEELIKKFQQEPDPFIDKQQSLIEYQRQLLEQYAENFNE